jgi:transposase InsO family protein
VEFQSFFSAEETVKAVQRFETHAADRGIRVKEYHSDNGTAFTAQKFRQHLYDKGQTERFAATGSHHQNGRAERAI